MIHDSENTKHLEAIKSIQKKLLGKELSYKEIFTLMDQITQKKLSDVLTTYFVASSFKEGYSPKELFYFTKAMVETGTKLKFDGIVADKHSTGGVAGTRTTLIIVPIIAAAGFTIPKTSSRAITTPAGTADVMELIANVNFTPKQVYKIIDRAGGCIVWNGQLGLAPADDIIIHVEAPLMFESFDKIIVSIMAKKIAVSANHLILDIPVGKTMKIHHFEEAELVAKKFIALGKQFDMKVVVDINETLEPAGSGVGAYLEAKDVLAVLEQTRDRPLRLEAKALRLAGKLLDICYKDDHQKKNGEDEARRLLTSGIALKKFREIVKAQGGSEEISTERLKTKALIKRVTSRKAGKIKAINNYNLNSIAKLLGAPVDKHACIYLYKHLDEKVDKREPLLELHSKNLYRIKEAEVTLENFPIYDIE